MNQWGGKRAVSALRTPPLVQLVSHMEMIVSVRDSKLLGPLNTVRPLANRNGPLDDCVAFRLDPKTLAGDDGKTISHIESVHWPQRTEAQS